MFEPTIDRTPPEDSATSYIFQTFLSDLQKVMFPLRDSTLGVPDYVCFESKSVSQIYQIGICSSPAFFDFHANSSQEKEKDVLPERDVQNIFHLYSVLP